MNKTIIGMMVGLAMLFVIVGCTREATSVVPRPKITNFAECVAAGNPVMESYPEQCRANGVTFVNEIQKLPITNFDECVAAGNPVARSYPAQCTANGQTFIEQLENETAPQEKMRVMPSNEPLSPAVQAAKDLVEKSTNTSAIVLSVNEVTWPDGCIGIVDPAATCIALATPGYNITIYAGESEFEVHTTKDGSYAKIATERHTGPLAI